MMISQSSVIECNLKIKQVIKLIIGTLVSFCFLLTLGCKEKVDLPPEGYFKGQQLTLAQSISRGRIDDVKRLAKKTDLNSPGKSDMTLLFFSLGAATYGNATPERLQIVTELVKAGADPLQPRPNGMSSPAEFSASAEKDIWLKALLEGGLSSDAKDRIFDEPIIFQTIKAKNTDTLKAFLDDNANIDIKNSLGETMLMAAFFHSSFEHVKLLIQKGSDPNPINKNGLSLAEIVNRQLQDSKEGSDYYYECLEIKKMMIAHGVVWP